MEGDVAVRNEILEKCGIRAYFNSQSAKTRAYQEYLNSATKIGNKVPNFGGKTDFTKAKNKFAPKITNTNREAENQPL